MLGCFLFHKYVRRRTGVRAGEWPPAGTDGPKPLFGAGKPTFGGTEVVEMRVRAVEWPPAGTDGPKPLFGAGSK